MLRKRNPEVYIFKNTKADEISAKIAHLHLHFQLSSNHVNTKT